MLASRCLRSGASAVHVSRRDTPPRSVGSRIRVSARAHPVPQQSEAEGSAPPPPQPACSADPQAAPAAAAASQAAVGGFLASADQQAAAFGVLSATSVALAVVALAAPNVLLSGVLGVEPTALDVCFLRIAGATMAISAAVELSLKDAVEAGHLKSTTYQRLLVAVVAKSTLYGAAFFMSPELWRPALAALYPPAAAASIAVSVATLRAGFRQAGAASFSEGLSGIWGFSRPQTAASWGYSVAMLLYAATVAACFAPEAIFTGEPMTAAGLLLKHTWAPGFLLAGGACYVLKDAADRSRLGASTFVRLNWGVAAVEAGYSIVFGGAIASGLAAADAAAFSNLGGSLVLAVFCGFQAVTAKAK